MQRRIWNLCCGASVAGFLAGMAVWGWSYRAAIRVGWGSREGPHLVKLERGKVVLIGPPKRLSELEEARADAFVAGMNNRAVSWTYWVPRGEVVEPTGLAPGEGIVGADLHGHWLALTATFGYPAFLHAVLRAMDDPDRFVAATVLLEQYGDQGMHRAPCLAPFQPPEKVVKCLLYGLELELLPEGSVWERDEYLGGENHEYYEPVSWRVSAASRSVVRNKWCEILGNQVMAMPWWPVGMATLVCPVIWSRGWWMVRRRRRMGLCLGCGYDLRASVGRCPECGVGKAA